LYAATALRIRQENARGARVRAATSPPVLRRVPRDGCGGAFRQRLRTRFRLSDDGDLHAWAEVYPQGGGWRRFDPSRGLAVGASHVPVAAAADATLAAPVSGTYRGDAKSKVSSRFRCRWGDHFFAPRSRRSSTRRWPQNLSDVGSSLGPYQHIQIQDSAVVPYRFAKVV
jgi:hypothetical protein